MKILLLGATGLAVESLVFIWVHSRYREMTTPIIPIILNGVLDVLMAFIAYGRLVLAPIF